MNPLDPLPEAEQQSEKLVVKFFALLTQLMHDTFAEFRKTRIAIDVGEKPNA